MIVQLVLAPVHARRQPFSFDHLQQTDGAQINVLVTVRVARRVWSLARVRRVPGRDRVARVGGGHFQRHAPHLALPPRFVLLEQRLDLRAAAV